MHNLSIPTLSKTTCTYVVYPTCCKQLNIVIIKERKDIESWKDSKTNYKGIGKMCILKEQGGEVQFYGAKASSCGYFNKVLSSAMKLLK